MEKMKKWFSAAFAAAVFLTGCSAAPAADSPKEEETTKDNQKEDKETPVKDESSRSDKTESSSSTSDNNNNTADSDSQVLSVDEVLENPDEWLNETIVVRGMTPQAVSETNAEGQGISFLYQEGQAGDTDHAIRFIVPEDAPGTSVIEVSGTLHQDADGYILENTSLAD